MPDTTVAQVHYSLQAMATDLLPGFGCFGPKGSTGRVLKVNGFLNRLVMSLESGVRQDWMMPRVTLFDGQGREIQITSLVERVLVRHQDRLVDRPGILENLLAKRPVRLRPSLRPEVTYLLKFPVFVSRIELGNRAGSYGPRNRHLCIEGFSDQSLVSRHHLADPVEMEAEFIAIHHELGLPLPDTSTQPTRHCEKLREMILAALEADKLKWSPLRLLQLLPVGEEAAGMTPFSLRISAETVLATLGERQVSSTASLAVLSPLLSSPKRIEQLMQEVNRIASRRLGRVTSICMSKHSVQEPLLVRRRDDMLAALDAIFPALEACGVQGMICYGSLLGAVREGGFLKHDDDVDLLYFDGSTSREEMLARRSELQEKLIAHGFRYLPVKNGENVNFHMKNESVKLDFFPTWAEGDKLHVMLKYPRYHPVARDLILPLSSVRLHGHVYPAPAKPQAFLATRYGKGWSKSDPYYEWPWPLTKGQKLARLLRIFWG